MSGGLPLTPLPQGPRLPLTYVLPVRDATPGGDLRLEADLTGYLAVLSGLVEVVVVDGSPEPVFDRHARAWSRYATHVRPDPLGFANGKVTGVTTGVRLAHREKVVLADDDVRYDEPALRRMCQLLDRWDLVRPQNYFRPCPWHAAWDTARSLLNRAVGADFPGTVGLRRSRFLAMGGYDGDVLFENLELSRTVAAAGGRETAPLDLYVVRRPPHARHFRSQRVRQAYDELARPLRFAAFLTVIPVATVAVRRAPWSVPVAALGSVGLAEFGRRRRGGTAVFPARASWFAPLWIGERAVCVWVVLWLRWVRGGVRYADRRLRVAAHSRRQIRHRLRTESGTVAGLLRPAAGAEAGAGLPAAAGAEADAAVAAVTERLERGATAPAQRDGAPSRVDLATVLVDEPEVAADDQWTVPVGHDRRLVTVRHMSGSSPAQVRQTGRPPASTGSTP